MACTLSTKIARFISHENLYEYNIRVTAKTNVEELYFKKANAVGKGHHY